MAAKYKPMMILNALEVEEKMERGLCFICDKPFTLEHQLLHHKNIQLIMMDDEDEVEAEREGLWQQASHRATNNIEEPQTEKHEEIYGIVEDSYGYSICNSQTPKSTSTDMNLEESTDSAPFFLNSLMLGDDDPKKSQHDIQQIPISTTHTPMLEFQVTIYPTNCLTNCLTELENTTQMFAKLSKPTCMECVADLPEAHETLNSTLSLCKPVKDITRKFESLIEMKALSNHWIIAPPPEPPDAVKTPLFNLSLLLAGTGSFIAAQYHNFVAYKLFPLSVWITITTAECTNNGLKNVDFSLSESMDRMHIVLGDVHNAFIDLLCSSWWLQCYLQEMSAISERNGNVDSLNGFNTLLQHSQELAHELLVRTLSYSSDLFHGGCLYVLANIHSYFNDNARVRIFYFVSKAGGINHTIEELLYEHLILQRSEAKEVKFYAPDFLLFLLAIFDSKMWIMNLVYEERHFLNLMALGSIVRTHKLVQINDGNNMEVPNVYGCVDQEQVISTKNNGSFDSLNIVEINLHVQKLASTLHVHICDTHNYLIVNIMNMDWLEDFLVVFRDMCWDSFSPAEASSFDSIVLLDIHNSYGNETEKSQLLANCHDANLKLLIAKGDMHKPFADFLHLSGLPCYFQKRADISERNGSFSVDSLNGFQILLQHVQELEIALQHIYIWSYFNTLFYENYWSVGRDHHYYFNHNASLIVEVAFTIKMIAKTYGSELIMVMSYGENWYFDKFFCIFNKLGCYRYMEDVELVIQVYVLLSNWVCLIKIADSG